jgi:hypothetical protein
LYIDIGDEDDVVDDDDDKVVLHIVFHLSVFVISERDIKEKKITKGT